MKINVTTKSLETEWYKGGVNKLAKIIKSSKILEDVIVDFTNTILTAKKINVTPCISQEILKIDILVFTPKSFMVTIMIEQINIYKVSFILSCDLETETFDLSTEEKEKAIVTTFELQTSLL